MLVSGKNVVKEILKNPKSVKKIYLWDNFNDKDVICAIQKHKLAVENVDKRRLDQLANENHQGIIIDIRDYEYCQVDDMIKENGLIVMLDHLEDPHNFGAILRTCEAAGVDGIIIPKDRSVDITGTVMKTSAGALENVKIAKVANLCSTIEYLKKKDYWIVSSDMDGTDFSKCDYNMSTCLVIGSEGLGISRLVKEKSDFVVSIPMAGKINSLNASVAAGILIYEVIKQRSN